MHQPYPQKTRIRPPQRTVRAMLALPGQGHRPVDFTVPSGITDKSLSALLNTHLPELGRVPRGDFGRKTIAKAEKSCAELLRKMARETPYVRYRNTDPLLWLLRSRRAIRTASLALHNLEPSSPIPGPFGIPEGDAQTSVSYSALASWACGCWKRYAWVNRLCDALSPGHSDTWNADPGTLSESRYWLFWASRASGFSPEETWLPDNPSAQLYRVCWEDMATGSVVNANHRIKVERARNDHQRENPGSGT